MRIRTAAIVLVAVLRATAVHASERDGVTCPAASIASARDGVLKCRVTLEFTRLSICPRVDYPNYTQIELPGVDQCKPQVAPLSGKASVDSAMTPLTGEPVVMELDRTVSDPKTLLVIGPVVAVPPPDSAYQRRIDQVSQDRFKASQVVYLWPNGMPAITTVGHDARNGVGCPSGFGAEVIDGRGLRCRELAVHRAGCDGVNPLNPLSPWTVERRVGRDLCVSRDITGNRVIGQYTIPTDAGYIGAMGNPAEHGWTLDTDRSSDVDYWIKNGTAYKYPVAR